MTNTRHALEIRDGDLPALHDAASTASLEGQNRFIWATRIKLGLAVSAALAGALVRPGDLEAPLAYAVAAGFLGILVVEAWIWANKPERTWYDGRALAESAKTMGWRYTVGAAPYPLSDHQAHTRLISDLGRVLADAQQTEIHPSSGLPISDAMQRVRAADLPERKTIYLRDRIEDQRAWYAKKSRISRRRASQWRTALIAAEGLGILAAFLRASGNTDIDFAGIIAALVGAGAAWLGIRQHESIQRAYALASHELSLAAEGLRACTTEDEWAQLAADAEEAISREHTMWRASRSAG